MTIDLESEEFYEDLLKAYAMFFDKVSKTALDDIVDILRTTLTDSEKIKMIKLSLKGIVDLS